MDRTLSITIGILLAGMIGFGAVAGWSGFATGAYQNSLSGTYSYSLTVSTDAELTNVTFFIPVPEDRSGNSPIIGRFSSRGISGIPNEWTTTLFSTGKTTVVKVTAPHIIPPASTTPDNPFVIAIPVSTGGKTRIETRFPAENGVMFRPVQKIVPTNCRDSNEVLPGAPSCFGYEIPVYADYQAKPGASVRISSALTGRNDWKILEPGFNEYRAGFILTLAGEHHGWEPAQGSLVSGIGSYDIP